MINEIKPAIDVLSKVMKTDSDFAWSWQSDLVLVFFTEGLDLCKANKAAARFMLNRFGVDMTKHVLFSATQRPN